MNEIEGTKCTFDDDVERNRKFFFEKIEKTRLVLAQVM
jgi:hypothetical protein